MLFYNSLLQTESPSCVPGFTGIEVVANNAIAPGLHKYQTLTPTFYSKPPSFWELPINVSSIHQHDKMALTIQERNIYVAIRKQSFTIFPSR